VGAVPLNSMPDLVPHVVIQDRARLFRESLRLVLDTSGRVAVSQTVVAGDELEEFCRAEPVDAVVLEATGVGWDVAALVDRLRSDTPSLLVVGTCATRSRAAAVDGVPRVERSASGWAFLCGIVGGDCRAPSVTPDDGLAAGPTRWTTGAADGGVAPGDLTRREHQVLALISGGLTTRQIAERLEISVKTVESRRQTLFLKLGVQSQAHAVSVAMRTGILGHRSGPRSPSEAP
jgi:DNA-binding NarL/FixJ family response regulator